MNVQFYFEKMLESEEFKKFKEEHKDSFFCSGFFVIDKKGGENSQNLDYFVKSINKAFSFKINNKIELSPIENFGNEFIPEELSEEISFDFTDIEDIILNKMEQEKIKNKIEKMLFSLQAKDKKNYLLGTVFISGLGIIKVKIDLKENKIVDFEKKSFFDMVKIVKK